MSGLFSKNSLQKEVFSDIEKLNISMLNQLTLLLGVIQLIFIPFFYFSSRPGTTWILLAAACVYFTTPFLSRANKFTFACYWYLLTSFVEIYWLTLLLGYRSGMFLPFISSSFLPLIFFRPEQKIHRRWLSILPIILVFGASMGIGESLVEQITLPPLALDIFRSGIICSVIVVIFQAVFLFENKAKIQFDWLNKTIEEKTHAEKKAINLSEELTASNEQLRRASKAKSEFLANMSHEIRTPMNAIIGFTDMALDTKLTAEQKEYINTVHNAGESLLGLINDILDFSKIEAGKLDVENIEFDLKDIVTRTGEINKVVAAEKGLEFTTVAPELNHLLKGDPARLQQILTNLLGNAIKFTLKGSIILKAEIDQQTDDAVSLTFSVQDTGIGIPEDAQETIFNAFSQADGTVTRKYGGTGLGLTISNQLVGLLGGTKLQLESREGKGTTVYFTLYFKFGSKIKEKVQKTRDKNLKKHNASYRILLVEDNPTNIKLAQGVLTKLGHEVAVAQNGRLGVEAAFKDNFDLILMDMMMPEMDGLTATREIRNREIKNTQKIHIPIIAMTANAMKSDREKCLDAGMDDFIAKPIKINLINQMIEQCLKKCETKCRSQDDSTEKEIKKELNILVVDDNNVNCMLLSAGLKKAGYQSTVVHNGQEAVDTYQNENMDIILMDIQMPIMDGLKATRKIREYEAQHPEQRRVPIIAITAHADSEEWMDAGMDEGYKKPVRIPQLIKAIETLTEKASA